MHCKGKNLKTFLDPAYIKPVNIIGSKNTIYDLVILKTIKSSATKVVFKVTSYHVGNYNTGFKIVSEGANAMVSPIVWNVKSVISPQKKQTIKPYPPYGLWKSAIPFWYSSFIGIILLSVIIFVGFKIRSFLKIKKTKQQAYKRLKHKNPLSEFISQLNLLARDINTQKNTNFVDAVKKSFELFLENQFFISAVNQPSQKIIKQLKKYYPVIYKECNILDLFYEINKLLVQKINQEDAEWLLNKARDKAVLCVKIFQERK